MIYIALLRGINVGGKNIIKMTDLKYMFENLGYVQVKTYIQSGNVLFVSNDEEELLKQKIETSPEQRKDIVDFFYQLSHIAYDYYISQEKKNTNNLND